MADYGEAYAPVCRHETARAFFASAAHLDQDLWSCDVRSAFLTAPLNRPVYMNPPQGHERPGYKFLVKKAIYGLCDAPRAYHQDFKKNLLTLDIAASSSDSCLFYSRNKNYPSLWILCYVDDLIVRQNKMTPVANFESFVTETSARKVLKELLAEFNVTAEVLTTKLSTQ